MLSSNSRSISSSSRRRRSRRSSISSSSRRSSSSSSSSSSNNNSNSSTSNSRRSNSRNKSIRNKNKRKSRDNNSNGGRGISRRRSSSCSSSKSSNSGGGAVAAIIVVVIVFRSHGNRRGNTNISSTKSSGSSSGSASTTTCIRASTKPSTNTAATAAAIRGVEGRGRVVVIQECAMTCVLCSCKAAKSFATPVGSRWARSLIARPGEATWHPSDLQLPFRRPIHNTMLVHAQHFSAMVIVVPSRMPAIVTNLEACTSATSQHNVSPRVVAPYAAKFAATINIGSGRPHQRLRRTLWPSSPSCVRCALKY